MKSKFLEMPVVLVLIGLGLGLATPARAEVTELECTQPGTNWKLLLEIDLSAKTALVWASIVNKPADPPANATVSDDKVTWAQTSGAGSYSFSLDRNNGTLIEILDGRSESWYCKKASKVL